MSQELSPLPHTLREINNLPDADKFTIYTSLLPDWVYERFGIDPISHTVDGQSVVDLHAVKGSRSVELSLFHEPKALEPSIYIHIADSMMQQLMVLLVVMNDPASPRFYVDVMPDGSSTNLGTSQRNLPEELRAMQDGLAPGQVRHGLRGFRRTVPYFEQFVARMGHDLYLIEPLSYHNAIVFERYGFGYTHGKKEMERIHREFMPGGDLYVQMDDSTPFRQSDGWQTVRGRSWAIHDGVLGHAFTGFHMFKRVGREANMQTFPNMMW